MKCLQRLILTSFFLYYVTPPEFFYNQSFIREQPSETYNVSSYDSDRDDYESESDYGELIVIDNIYLRKWENIEVIINPYGEYSEESDCQDCDE